MGNTTITNSPKLPGAQHARRISVARSSVVGQVNLDRSVPELSALVASQEGSLGLHGTAAFALDAAGRLGLGSGTLVDAKGVVLGVCQRPDTFEPIIQGERKLTLLPPVGFSGLM
jgi:hypothetical protein